jgi:glycosyltransferase involved in cell wall biosynthesis
MQYIPSLSGVNYKYFNVPDPFIGWLPFAILKGINIIKKEKVDVIVSTSMPNTCHLVALILKKISKLPWIADFREAWTQNPFIDYPKIVLNIENKMESAVIRNADKITAINDPIRNDLIVKYHDQTPEKFMTIPHGFDLEDFQDVEKSPSKKFTITYTGSLYGRRSPKTFLEAIKEIIEDDKNMKSELRIQFIGNVHIAKEIAERLNLTDLVTSSGFVSHQQVFSYIVNSNILLLIIGSGKNDNTISTGKLFEYMGSGTPILALVPEGVAAGIVRSANIGVVVHPNDIEGIKKAILQLYKKYKKGELKIEPNQEIIKQHDMRILSKKVAEVLDEVKSTDSYGGI